MPVKLLSEPSFIRPAEIMGADIQAAFAAKTEEIADMIATGIKGRNGNILKEARTAVSKIYTDAGLEETNRARLIRITNRGADEVSDSSILKRQRAGIDAIIDNVGGAVQKSADRYLDRIVMKKVAKVVANGGSKEDVRVAVAKSMGDAEHYWKNVSNTATSRMFHYGSMLAAENSGLHYCTYVAVVDDRTTDFCRAIDGRRISLANAIVKAEAILNQSPDEMLDTDFWETANELVATGSNAIVTNGLTLPPFHGHCRTTTWFT